jgi:P-type E1-E2 ATPase
VVARIDDLEAIVGNAAHLAMHGSQGTDLSPADAPGGGTQVWVARRPDGQPVQVLGAIAVHDEIRPDSAQAIGELHRAGMRTVLLTGDIEATAHAIARQVGIDDVRAQVRPAQKAHAIGSLRTGGRRVAMVGDGINDAPALAAADLGIAIGSGSDIAKEAGDIVLVSGSLHGVSAAIRLSRATMRVIRQNLFWAFAYNVVLIPLAALGFLNPLLAALAMALSDVTVIGNALRLRVMRID